MQQVLNVTTHIAIAILVFLLMITIHELGHYVVGKIFKFRINEFAVGLGPKLLSKKLKNGEEFSLRALPLGGYCAFDTGEDDNSANEAHLSAAAVFGNDFEGDSRIRAQVPKAVQEVSKTTKFDDQKPYKRILVFLGGAGFNIISAVIFSFIFLISVGYNVPVVDVVLSDSAGVPYTALQVGDEIIAVDGRRVTPIRGYGAMISGFGEGETLTLTVIRDEEEVILPNILIQRITYVDEGGIERTFVGVGYRQLSPARRRPGVGRSLLYAIPFTGQMSIAILRVFGMLLTGGMPLNELSGPIGTVGAIASFTMMSMSNILILLPLIAANFAIFNLLPIPALDGARVVFALIEWIRGKPIPKRVENRIHMVGFLAIMGLMILIITPLDIMRLIGR